MAIYTVQTVFRGKEFPSKFGQMVSYKLGVQSEDGGIEPVELNQKVETPPPLEGQKINGHIEETQYGKKLKKDPIAPNADMRPMNAVPYHAPQSSKSHDSQPAVDWSAKEDKIAFQNATNAAATLLQGTGDIKQWAAFQATIYAAYRKNFYPEPTPPVIHGDSDEIGSDLDF